MSCFSRSVLMEACPPSHLGHGVVDKVSMRVIYKPSSLWCKSGILIL